MPRIRAYELSYKGRDSMAGSGLLLLLDDSRTKAAILTLDLINAPSEMTAVLREAIASAAGIPPENILVATSHNHSGPSWANNPAWAREVALKASAAAKKSASTPIGAAAAVI